MRKLVGYRCMQCAAEYPPEPFRYQCPRCRNNLDVIYDYRRLRRRWSRSALARDGDRSLWRYLPLLPVEQAPENRSLQVGGTPLVRIENAKIGGGSVNLFVKDDTRNPSGSLKDRATEVGLRHAVEEGAELLVVASTGNAAASTAALAAFHGFQAVILVPAAAPPAKLTQIAQHGVTLCPVKGSYDEAYDLSIALAEEYGWYCRSTGYNPILSEGKKTAALELAEQLDWQVPDKIFVPVGDGCIIGGMYKGWFDLVRLGWVDRLPQIIAVQAEGSSAVVRALESGGELTPVTADTVADSIAVDYPRDGLKAVRAVKASNGWGMTVSDEEILEAQKRMSETTGIFTEPASAAAFAGFLKAMKNQEIGPEETVVVLATGTGLKDIPTAQKSFQMPAVIEPTLESFQRGYLSKIQPL
jgi:threonine synthase